jgi:Icc protein
MAVTVVHLSDFHVTADETFRLKGDDPRAGLTAVMGRVLADEPDLLLVGGDVSHDASQESYDFVGRVFEPVTCPIVATPGNHDDPTLLEDLFGDSRSRATDLLADEGVLLRVFNSQILGREDGRIAGGVRRIAGAGELELVLLHHDLVQLGAGGRPGMAEPTAELAAVLGLGRPTLVLTGHRHTASDVSIGSMRILGAPATSTQFEFVDGEPRRAVQSAPAFRVIDLEDAAVVSTTIRSVS